MRYHCVIESFLGNHFLALFEMDSEIDSLIQQSHFTFMCLQQCS